MAGRAEDYKRKAEECMDAAKSAAHLDVKINIWNLHASGKNWPHMWKGWAALKVNSWIVAANATTTLWFQHNIVPEQLRVGGSFPSAKEVAIQCWNRKNFASTPKIAFVLPTA